MESYYKRKYNLQKFKPLVHTFNTFPHEESFTGVPGELKEVYRLVAIGNFNQSNVDATRRLIRAIKHHPKYELTIYTPVPKWLLAQRGLDVEAFEYREAIPPEHIHNELQKYDLAVLTHGFTGGYGDIEYQTIFPTRTIPLLLGGKPILAHSPPGSFLNEFLSQNQCAELVDSIEARDILIGLNKISSSHSYQEFLVRKAHEASTRFYGPNVAKQLRKTLNDPHYAGDIQKHMV